MPRYLQAAGSHSSARPDCHHKANGSRRGGGTRGLSALGNDTQSFAKQPVAPLDLIPCQQVLHPHPIALFGGRRILGGDPLIGKQLQIMLRRRYSDIEARCHLSARGRTVLGQESNDGHPRQVPERVNDRLQMSCGLRVGIPGHTCNLAVPTCVLA
jgi:hypothetical protein